ncbi:UDP-glucuronosyl/UDP-glucosyltransferase [Corchorus olitorius]|uniref:UDP-glucuronosyl/UDP-glucosyltransferase n=1 Tax=Corchorus olitorius TaxID=93759 RepID=A0A1R3I176_9ROSI|nr:UDP-glucuronosyl/UDP-glucosyltransferase [Corchorus olitorius]
MEPKKSHGVIVLFPMPFQGHMNPMLQLAKILHYKGFSITIIHTRFNSPNPSNYPHFRFFSISDGIPEDQVVPSDNSDVIALMKILNLNCLTPFRDCLSELQCSSNSYRIVCLITDGIWHITQAIANDLKVPRIVLATSNASAILTTPFLQERDSQVENRVPDVPPCESENKIERGEIERAIRRLMVGGEGQEMRHRIKLLKDKLNLCLKPGGSSYKSLDNLVTYMLS